MGYFLGIDVGAARTVAAVARAGSDDVTTVDLEDPDGADGEVGVDSVLHLGQDGTLAVGREARRWEATEPDRVVSGFPGRIGDDAMLLAGEPWAPEELTAWLVRWVVDRVAEREGGVATAVAVTHPASADADRTRLLAAAVAEQDLDVAFLDPTPDDTAPDGTAREAALVLRSVATAGSAEGGGSGRHLAVDRPTTTSAESLDGGGSGRHLAVEPGATATSADPLDDDGADRRPAAALDGSGPHPVVDGAPGTAPATVDGSGSGRHAVIGPVTADGTPPQAADEAGSGRYRVVGGAIVALAAGRESDTADGGTDPSAEVDGPDAPADPAGRSDEPDGDEERSGEPGQEVPDWDMPVPRSHGSGAYPADPGPRPDPATVNLVADLLGFSGGMGATNTAGLLSGYTPPQGIPESWSGATRGGTATATGRAVALPSQRAGSGRWSAVAAEDDLDEFDDLEHEDGAPPVAQATVVARVRNSPTMLVTAGGMAAAVAMVGALFLWPAPRTTNTASRSVAAVPVQPTEQTVAPAPPVALTPAPEPVPTHHPRPVAPRPRRPAPPPVTASAPATETTPPATESAEPTGSTAPATTAVSTAETTPPPTTKPNDDR